MVENEYAKAMYELATENKKEEIFDNNFLSFCELLKDEDFFNVLKTPNIDISKKKEIIHTVLKGFDETFVNFINVLLDHNRIAIIKDIQSEFKKLILNKNDIVKVIVYSVKDLSNKEINHLTKALQNKYIGKKLEIENIIKPELIGGIQIVANGESLDMSLKNSLDLLKESL